MLLVFFVFLDKLPESRRTISLQVHGRSRSYLVLLPEHRNRSADLVVFLPGIDETAAIGEARTGLDAGANRHGAVLVYGQGVGNSWNAGGCCGSAHATNVDDVAYVTALIADARHRFGIRSSRVDLIGFSNGALMAFRFACARSDLVRTVVAGSGTALPSACSYTHPVSLLAMNGKRDRTIPYTGSSEFPAVGQTVLGVAVRDGCTGVTPKQVVSRHVVKVDATGCPNHTHVELLLSESLDHRWAHGIAGSAQTGLDESALTWNWVAQFWH